MTNQNPIRILQQFHTIAAAQKLSATAILLWQYVYFIGAAQGCFTELHLRTADVQNALAITRNGLQKVRRALVTAGLLQVRIDARQQVYYTLTIDSEPIRLTDDSETVDQTKHEANAEAKRESRAEAKRETNAKAKTNCEAKPYTPAKPYIPDAQYPGDIIRNDTYRKLVKSFCSRLDPQEGNRLEISLYHFLHKRKQAGKTLTKAGLDALLDKLVQLAEENVHIMVNIVEQSIQRGWMGVYAYSGSTAAVRVSAPATSVTKGCSRPSRIPAYETAYVDLSFLER